MLAAASEACPPGAPSRMALQNGNAPNHTAGIPPAVLHKEAIYAAVGTGAYDLYDFIDFQPWLRTTLVQVGPFLTAARLSQHFHLCSTCLLCACGATQIASVPHACSGLYSHFE